MKTDLSLTWIHTSYCDVILAHLWGLHLLCNVFFNHFLCMPWHIARSFNNTNFYHFCPVFSNVVSRLYILQVGKHNKLVFSHTCLWTSSGPKLPYASHLTEPSEFCSTNLTCMSSVSKMWLIIYKSDLRIKSTTLFPGVNKG